MLESNTDQGVSHQTSPENNEQFEKLNERLKEVLDLRSRIRQRFRSIEHMMLGLISTLLFAYKLQSIAREGLSVVGFLESYAFFEAMVVAMLPLFFVVLFRLTFGVLPFELLRNRFAGFEKKMNLDIESMRAKRRQLVDSSEKQQFAGEAYFAKLVDSSRELSNNIQMRAGVYLLLGGIIAIGGLMYFSNNFSETLLRLIEVDSYLKPLPFILSRFGALVFLELLAFFFLRQYKFTMDEFRYYEGIKRSREEKLFYLKYLKTEMTNKEMIEYLRELDSYDRIKDGDSSIVLESKRLNKDELEVFHKILDNIKFSK